MCRGFIQWALCIKLGSLPLAAAVTVFDFASDPSLPNHNWPGYGWTDNYTKSYAATASNTPGLVDNGFVTVDFIDQWGNGIGEIYAYDQFDPGYDLSNAAQISASLRREAGDQAEEYRIYILGSNDLEYNYIISVGSLSYTEFRTFTFNLSDDSGGIWVSSTPAAASRIGIRTANMYGGNPLPSGSQYNFSLDNISITNVPEPTSFGLTGCGLLMAALLRRRAR